MDPNTDCVLLCSVTALTHLHLIMMSNQIALLRSASVLAYVSSSCENMVSQMVFIQWVWFVHFSRVDLVCDMKKPDVCSLNTWVSGSKIQVFVSQWAKRQRRTILVFNLIRLIATKIHNEGRRFGTRDRLVPMKIEETWGGLVLGLFYSNQNKSHTLQNHMTDAWWERNLQACVTWSLFVAVANLRYSAKNERF